MDFSQVEATFAELKAQYEAGDLTEEQFRAQLQELMVQDEQDRWWIIGYKSGLWYYHDGQQWVQDDPPPVAQRREQVEALCTEGATALDAGEWETAVERYEAALALEPDHAEAAAGLAKASAGLAEARAQAEAQAQVGVLTAEGAAALSVGDWETAVKHYEAALALEPDHAEAAAGLSEASAGLAEARAQAEAQAQVGVLTAEGSAALSAGEWETAVERYEAALALEPGNADASAGLAEARAGAEAQARAEAEAQKEAEAQAEAAARPQPEPLAQPATQPRPAAPVRPETESVTRAAPAAAVKKRSRNWLLWIVAALIAVIGVVWLLLNLGLLGNPPAQKSSLWADRDVIRPGECTVLHWEAPAFDGVRLVGPNIDDAVVMPPWGRLEVCPEGNSLYELKGPEWEHLSELEIQVRE